MQFFKQLTNFGKQKSGDSKYKATLKGGGVNYGLMQTLGNGASCKVKLGFDIDN